MGQRPSQKLNLRDILPPLAGLLLMGVLFIPAVRHWLDSLFVLAIGLLSFAVIVLIVRVLWRTRTAKEQEEEEEVPILPPIYIHSEEERAQFRAMCGVTERPAKPMKVVTPEVGDREPAGDSADKG